MNEECVFGGWRNGRRYASRAWHLAQRMQAVRRKWAVERPMKDGALPLRPAAPGPPHRPLSSAPGAWGDRFLLLWTGPGLRCGHRDA